MNAIRLFWLSFAGGIAFIFIFFFLLSVGLFGELPGFEELENPESSLASEIITTDGVVLGKYYTQNRSNVDYTSLPLCLKQALIATEDIRFEEHAGIDFKAFFRALFSAGKKGGGSTITQQLAKNLFPRERMNKLQLIIRKLKEWIIAVRLESSYTKQEIMAMYLNTVEFSDNAFGIKSAAKTYFNKKVDSLKTEEAAVLVGMLKAPYQYNPRLHPQAALARRNTVLAQMHKYGFLSSPQFDSLKALPIKLNFNPESHEEGLARHFREYLRLWLKKYLSGVKKPDGSNYNLYRDGLRIYVTLDSRLQRYAEEAQYEHMKELQKIFFEHWKDRDPWKDFPKEWEAIYTRCERYVSLKKQGLRREQIDKIMRTPVKMRIFTYEGDKDTVMSPYDSLRYYRMILQNGFVAIDPSNGYVRAWAGGISFRHFQYDHVNINTKRQVGSTFKPFVYATAIRDKGYSPCMRVPNQPVTFEAGDPRFGLVKDWTPKNSDGKYGGMLSLKEALANSINTVTAYLMHEMTPAAVIQLAKNMGVESYIPEQPAICLGATDISLIEMVGAYATFANKGVYTQPIFVTRIEDRDGNVISEFTAQQREVFDEATNYTIVELLRGVVQHGTGLRLRYRYKLPGDIIGKTGTTSNYADGWFIGCTPHLVAGSWTGCDDRYIRFRSMQYGQGATMALPVWAYFFQKVYSDSLNFASEFNGKDVFPQPENMPASLADCIQHAAQMSEKRMGSYYD
ncbi:MAG: transglycosylase domain-containing protein [Chitinophagales bacterium]|nr:transglycosylase domain-containing protein [Chitinophagales bacterium]MDW8274056.1 transglycosylase domain-containing protein [Chitinophagales bacterium]